MRKMTLELNGTETDPSPPAVFERQVMRTGKPRIVMYVPDGRADLIHRLSALLPEPFHVLYVLHTPRGEGEPGRYQSPALRGVRDDKGQPRNDRVGGDQVPTPDCASGCGGEVMTSTLSLRR